MLILIYKNSHDFPQILPYWKKIRAVEDESLLRHEETRNKNVRRGLERNGNHFKIPSSVMESSLKSFHFEFGNDGFGEKSSSIL